MRALSPDTVDDAFQAFFDMVDAPAALLDPEGVVLATNATFDVLCGTKRCPGPAAGGAGGLPARAGCPPTRTPWTSR